jgi:hypothetical protein
MSTQNRHSFRPGETILNGIEPATLKYREELLSYLVEYPEGNAMGDILGRLCSYTESGFYSACFELYLYHVLNGICKAIYIHPSSPDTTTHPDYKAEISDETFYIEATIALDSDEKRAQQSRLVQVVDKINNIYGNLALWVQPVTDIPADYPLENIEKYLRQEVNNREYACSTNTSNIRFIDTHNNMKVIIDFIVLNEVDNLYAPIVGAWGSPEAKEVNTANQIRRRAGIKAMRYGLLSEPYIIAIQPECEFPLNEKFALNALYGDETWAISLTTEEARQGKRQNNGVFNITCGGEYINRQISAMALYKEVFTRESYNRQLCVFHNPYAFKPLPINIFSGFPQLIFRDDCKGGLTSYWVGGNCPY